MKVTPEEDESIEKYLQARNDIVWQSIRRFFSAEQTASWDETSSSGTMLFTTHIQPSKSSLNPRKK